MDCSSTRPTWLLLGMLGLLWGCGSAPEDDGPRAGTGSRPQAGAGGGSAGGQAQAGAGAGAGGKSSDPHAGADAGGAAGSDSAPTAGAGPFDAGSAPDRNAVTPGKICRRLAEISCEAERVCCDDARRDKAACLSAFEMNCADTGMADRIAAQPEARFDAEQAEEVFVEIERLASSCDPTVKAFNQSAGGLRSLFTGTIEAGGDCTPALVIDLVQAGAAVVACVDPDEQSCLPSLLEWRCTPVADEGGACFVDNNCRSGLYCNNPDLNIAGSQCMARREVGATCTFDSQCESLFCVRGACVPAEPQVVYCPR